MFDGGATEPRAQRIGPYEVLLDIGSGGMGTISLARATGDELGVDGFARLVALKRPLGALVSDPEVLRRFLDEARLLARVHHANVVGIHQIGSDAVGHFLVLDYIEGGTLDELLARAVLRRKRLPPPVVLRILGEVLAGLHAVHEAADVEGRPLQMVHRDVSTQNVLVGRDGVSRIADFGIAKAITSSAVTDKAYLQGRIPYMAPEYLRREPFDQRLDVYAAGLTMWTALAGRLPWGDAAEAQMVKQIVFDGVPPLSSSGMTIAPAVEAIVARACSREPSGRFATAREMRDAIEALGRDTGWIASNAEVAAVVEELLGAEIRERRSAIARRLAAPDARAPLAAVVERAEAAAVGASAQPEEPAARAHAAPARPRSALVVGAVALVVVASAALVWRWRATPDLPAAPAPAASSNAAAPAVADAPIVVPARGEPPSVAPVAVAPASSAQGSAATVAPPSRPPASGGTRPARTPAAAPAGAPAALPTGISTNNPYR